MLLLLLALFLMLHMIRHGPPDGAIGLPDVFLGPGIVPKSLSLRELLQLWVSGGGRDGVAVDVGSNGNGSIGIGGSHADGTTIPQG